MSMCDIELLLQSRGRGVGVLKRYYHTAETKAKASAVHKGKVPWNKGLTGSSPWNKGLHDCQDNSYKKRAVITPFGEFGSVKEAGFALGHKSGSTIQKRIKKKVPGYEYL